MAPPSSSSSLWDCLRCPSQFYLTGRGCLLGRGENEGMGRRTRGSGRRCCFRRCSFGTRQGDRHDKEEVVGKKSCSRGGEQGEGKKPLQTWSEKGGQEKLVKLCRCRSPTISKGKNVQHGDNKEDDRLVVLSDISLLSDEEGGQDKEDRENKKGVDDHSDRRMMFESPTKEDDEMEGTEEFEEQEQGGGKGGEEKKTAGALEGGERERRGDRHHRKGVKKKVEAEKDNSVYCEVCGGLVVSKDAGEEFSYVVNPSKLLAHDDDDDADDDDLSVIQTRQKTFGERVCDGLESINPINLYRFAARVHKHVGSRFFILLLSVFGLVRGVLYGLSHRALLPYLKAAGQDAGTYQRIDALGTVIWSMMGLVGSISDSIPIGGYHKRYYMIIANIVGISGVSLFAFTPSSVVSQNVWLAGLSTFLVCTQMSTLVLMCSGKYSELMEKKPEIKADIVTFVFTCWMIGNLIGTSIVGPVSDAVGTRPLFYLALPLAIQSLIPIALGYLPEERVTFRVLTNKLYQHKAFFFMALLIGITGTGIVLITIVLPGEDKSVMMYYCSICTFVLVVACILCLPKQLAKCNLYLFLWGIVNISITGALDFFYTADEECIADGPHFDYTYYSTVISIVGTLANWVAIWIFHSFLSNWSFRRVFWLSIAVRCVASLFDYVMVTRANIRVGIPDNVMYLFGDAIILNLVNTLNHMPGYILTSRLCPKGLESTAYAVMDGMSHLGWNFSKQFGIFAINLAGITTKSTVSATDAIGGAVEQQHQQCNFDNLGTLTLITQFAFPLLAIPLSFLLLPNTRMSDRILKDAELKYDCEEDDEGDDNSRRRGDEGKKTVSLPSTIQDRTSCCKESERQGEKGGDTCPSSFSSGSSSSDIRIFISSPDGDSDQHSLYSDSHEEKPSDAIVCGRGRGDGANRGGVHEGKQKSRQLKATDHQEGETKTMGYLEINKPTPQGDEDESGQKTSGLFSSFQRKFRNIHPSSLIRQFSFSKGESLVNQQHQHQKGEPIKERDIHIAIDSHDGWQEAAYNSRHRYEQNHNEDDRREGFGGDFGPSERRNSRPCVKGSEDDEFGVIGPSRAVSLDRISLGQSTDAGTVGGCAGGQRNSFGLYSQVSRESFFDSPRLSIRGSRPPPVSSSSSGHPSTTEQ